MNNYKKVCCEMKHILYGILSTVPVVIIIKKKLLPHFNKIK